MAVFVLECPMALLRRDPQKDRDTDPLRRRSPLQEGCNPMSPMDNGILRRDWIVVTFHQPQLVGVASIQTPPQNPTPCLEAGGRQ